MTRPFADLVADLDLDFLHGARERRRHVHRRLVGFERDQRVLGLHPVAGLDVDLDHRHVVEVADVGHAHLGHAGRRAGRRAAAARRPASALRPRRGGRAHPHRRACRITLPFADLVADLDLDLLHDAGGGAGTSIVALSDSSETSGVLGLHRVAGLDVDLDHRHVLEVADVGHLDVDRLLIASLLKRSMARPARCRARTSRSRRRRPRASARRRRPAPSAPPPRRASDRPRRSGAA